MIVFTHIPKTAGTTLKMILRNNFGIRHIDAAKVKNPVYTASDLKFAEKVFPGPKAISGHNLVNPLKYIGIEGMQLLTVMRNPIQRCASHYQDEVLRANYQGSFSEWISDHTKQNLSVRLITGGFNLELAKQLLKEEYVFVGITEQFNESIKLLQLQLGLKLNVNYRRLITAKSNKVKKQVLNNPDDLNLLKEFNQLDLELYEFAMNEVFMPAIEKYQDQMEQVPAPVEKKDRVGERRLKQSVRFNKIIYRPAVKLFRP